VLYVQKYFDTKSYFRLDRSPYFNHQTTFKMEHFMVFLILVICGIDGLRYTKKKQDVRWHTLLPALPSYPWGACARRHCDTSKGILSIFMLTMWQTIRRLFYETHSQTTHRWIEQSFAHSAGTIATAFNKALRWPHSTPLRTHTNAFTAGTSCT